MRTSGRKSERRGGGAGPGGGRGGRALALFLFLLLAAVPAPVSASASFAADTSYVAAADGPDRFALARHGRPAALHLDVGADPGVRRALLDLRSDLGRVAGAEPELTTESPPAAGPVVLVGTLGRSPVIDRLAREGKLDVSGIEGKWETFGLQVVEEPLPGIERALVIAGSDRRGTIFGIYDLSREIGVSPWHWWADVPVPRRPDLFVLPGLHTRGEPRVKYRGIFINDEAPALAGWAHETFGGFDHRFYAHVYELILRLQGNYLWPAMWGRSLWDDDPESARLADEYGVVLGTSHHEPMMRAHVEWSRHGSGPWNYESNPDTLRAFWREGIERMGSHEALVTVGMRGDGDEPMTEGTAIALLERIVADQRRIIGEVTGRDPSATPQVWALYKEVQDYYDRGMRVPDDVTLLFADDNWGNVRRLPAPADTLREGGFGVYYHFDYVGGPRSYKWINTNQIERIWEQMHLAHRYGADRIWIVNVGDIKPMELPTEFFLDYAWDPDAWPAERLPEYTREWAGRQFGSEHAAEIGEILTRYAQFNSRRKPELLDSLTYSLTDYRESERVVEEYQALAERARRIGRELPEEYGDAYYQLVLYPVEASANLNALHAAVARNRLHARQGRASTNTLADGARALFERDAELTRRYHEEIAGGKWNHMMSQSHIGYTYWQQPPRNVMPRVDRIHLRPGAEMALAVEGEEHAWPYVQDGPALPDSVLLPEIDAFRRQSRYFEVFNRGEVSFELSVEAGAPWLSVSPAGAKVDQEQRVWVGVDWDRAPRGRHLVPITVSGSDGTRLTVHARIFNPESPPRDRVRGFVEGNGHVSMEAEHYTRAVEAAGVRWQTVPGLGRTLSGVTPFPVTAPSREPGGDGPRLEYEMHLFEGGEVEVHAFLSPTLDFTGSGKLRYAVSIDEEEPQIVDLAADASLPTWERRVADNVAVTTTRHRVDGPGRHVLRFWMVDPGVVLQKLVVDAGGLEPSYLGPPESFLGTER